MASTVPLSVVENGERRLADLDLAVEGDGWAPQAPQVPVRFGATSDEAAVLADGVRLAAGGRAQGRKVGQSVVYPSVALDTDLVVRPIPGGLQTFHVLRSAASPENLALELKLPDGARMSAKPDGGYEVVDAKAGMHVGDVRAWDADGEPVDATLTASDGELHFSVAHRDADVRYPVTVDPPIYSDAGWQWEVGGANGSVFANWQTATFGSFFPYAGDGYLGRGLYIRNFEATNHGQYHYGKFFWRAPGTSWIHSAEFARASHETQGTCAQYGFARGTDAAWQKNPITYCHSYYDAHIYDCLGVCGRGDLFDRGNQVQIVEFEPVGGVRPYAVNHVGGMVAYLGDDDQPWASFVVPSGWTRDRTAAITLNALDPGLGVQYSELTADVAWNNAGRRNNSCEVGRCSSEQAVSTQVGDLPEGVRTLTAVVEDPTTNPSAGRHPTTVTRTVRVDETEPNMSWGGTLAAARGRALNADTYSLTVNADDGTASDPRSGVASIEVLIDEQSRASAQQTCPFSQDSCPLTGSWTFDPDAQWGPGRHRVRVHVVDRAGNATDDEFDVFVPEPEQALPAVERESDTSTAQRLDGAAPGDNAGESVTGMGDVDGDLRSDTAVGAPGADPAGRTDAGIVYVTYTDAGTSARQLGTGAGYRILGAAAGDRVGTTVRNAGDVNGDDIPDLVIGAPGPVDARGNNARRGTVYVVFGAVDGTDVDLASLGSRGFRILGPSFSNALTIGPRAARPFGLAVGTGDTAADEATDFLPQESDFDDDGFADLVVGSSGASNGLANQAGAAFLVYGKADTTDVDLAAPGTKASRFDGAATADLVGYSVALPGDVNGDGFADAVLGAPGLDVSARSIPGGAYVVFGQSSRSATINLSSLGARGYRINGAGGEELGLSVDSAADADKDGLDDMLVAGRSAYVLRGETASGTRDAFAAPLMRVGGFGPDLLVKPAGDADIDGIPDLLVTAKADDAGRGSAWLIYGRDVREDVNLAGLPGHRGVKYLGSGTSVAFGFSADAIGSAKTPTGSDHAAGAPSADPAGRTDAGSVYVFAGQARRNCMTGIQFTEADHGAVVSCALGQAVAAIDRNGDGTVDEYRTPRLRVDDSGNRKEARNDTDNFGVVNKRTEWVVRRTGYIFQVACISGFCGATQAVKAKLYHRIRLSGKLTLHAGHMLWEGGPAEFRPISTAECKRVKRELDRRECLVDGQRLPGVLREAGTFYYGRGRGLKYGEAGIKAGSPFKPEVGRSHRDESGTYLWRVFWPAAFRFKQDRSKVFFGSFSLPSVFSARYRCQDGDDGQCLFIDS